MATIVWRMANPDLRSQWGNAVRERRKQQGLTQWELATAANIQQGTLSKIERGEFAPADALRIAIAQALECEVVDLFAYPVVTGEAS